MESEWDQLKLRSAIGVNVAVLRFGGCWWPENKDPKIQKLYSCYAFVFILNSLFLYPLTELIYAVLALNDIEKLTSGLFLFLTHVAEIGKGYKFSVRHTRVKRFIEDMENEMFKPRYPEQVSTMRASTKRMKIIYGIFQFFGVATCTLWAISPWLDRNEHEKIHLPLTGWYPFNFDRYPAFQIIFCLQILFATNGAMQNINFDGTISTFMKSICDQLDLLNDSLEYMRERCEADESGSDDIQRKMDAELERCVRHHKLILRMVEEFSDLFSFVLLGQFAITVFIMCMSMFKLSVVTFGSAQFISLITYQLCILTETFLFCWFGNEIMLKSSELSLSAFKNNWIDCSQKFKKRLLFVMVRTKVPMKVYAGGFVTVSVETFTAVMRTSYSYFAVLNRMHTEGN